jgi:hypothetical protein
VALEAVRRLKESQRSEPATPPPTGGDLPRDHAVQGAGGPIRDALHAAHPFCRHRHVQTQGSLRDATLIGVAPKFIVSA